jgi:hypothetical protein
LGLARAGLWSELLATDPDEWPSVLDSRPTGPEAWRDLAERGGYPVPAHTLPSPDARTLWFEGYASTYLERDVGQLSAIENLADMRRLMAALCLRLGGLLNKAEVARDLGVPQTTVKRYIDLLEVSNQLLQVPAYSVNRTKRLIKSPKVYWSDTGLALRLAGESVPRGLHLENIVANDLVAWSSVTERRPSILHWRTTSGAEVDFVIESGAHLLPVEVKSAQRVGSSDARHLLTFLSEYPDLANGGLLLHDGNETFWVARSVLAVPWHRVV